MASDSKKNMEQAIQVFKNQKITVLEPGQAEYRKAIATSNLLFRFSRPDCVVQPRTAEHVRTIVREAKARSIKLTIKGNGHSYAGHSTAFSGISLDLRGMKNAVLDMNSMKVTMDAGCQWGNVYEKLVIGSHDGYIINGGRCPTVGVSGFILGGGLGPFTRSFGMGADTLAEATLVTADGSIVTVKDSDSLNSDKGRLFWALCGAGGGNFGVVVQLKLHVKKLSNPDGMVVAGRYQWFPKDGFTDDVMETMNSFYAIPWPNQLTIDSTWMCDLRKKADSEGIRFNVSFDGTKEKYDELITQYVAHPDLQKQLKRRVLAEKSTRYLHETLAAQWFEEAERAYPENKTYELYSSFVFTRLSPFQTITDIIRNFITRFRDDFKGEQVNFLVTWIHSGGKASELGRTDTAFFWREALFHAYVTVEWVDKWMELDMRNFLTDVKTKLRPLSMNGEAAFINFSDLDFQSDFHENAYFGGNKGMLREVKQRWDPGPWGVFDWNQGVRRPGENVQEDRRRDEERTDSLASEQWAQSDKAAREQWSSNQWSYYRVQDVHADLQRLAAKGYGDSESD
ncbi:FAD-binding domain-containing protein [Pyrenochaeta sp. DS3sAY3a]|nr:FAD-binding domain-containing protein [Pyrenochaeta sp. DS3sAY3a]